MKLLHEGKAKADVTKLTNKNKYSGKRQVEGTANVNIQEGLEYLQMQGAVSSEGIAEGNSTVAAVLNDYANEIGKVLAPKPETGQRYRNVKLSFEHQGQIGFYDGEKKVGGCGTSGSHARLRISGFDIENIERDKGYGTEALKGLIDYSKKLGRVLVFETCGLGKTCEWLERRGMEILWWPKNHFDDHAYLVAPGQVDLKSEMNDMESCGFGEKGASMGEIREFGKLVRKNTKDIDE